MHDSVTAQRTQFGEYVRLARVGKSLTQAELGELIGCGQGKINKIEKHSTKIKLTDADAIISTLGIDADTARTMRRLAEATQQVERWSDHRAMVPQWFRRFVDSEPHATTICSWHSERIPGVLQSEPYMLALFGLDGSSEITGHIRNRIERTKFFDLPSPPQYHIILSESGFRRIPGDNIQVEIDQIDHLLRLDGTYPWLHIHVLPFDVPNRYTPPDYTIMLFDGRMRDFVFYEHLTKSEYLEKPEELHEFTASWDDLVRIALNRQDSRAFLDNLLRERRNALSSERRMLPGP